MKRNIVIVFLMFCFSVVCIAQSNRTRTISTTASTSTVSNGSKIFSLYNDGIWLYVDVDDFGREEENIYYGGRYYIDNTNIIHLERENGYRETATLQYDNNGKAIIKYKGYTFYQSYYDRLDEMSTWKVKSK